MNASGVRRCLRRGALCAAFVVVVAGSPSALQATTCVGDDNANYAEFFRPFGSEECEMPQVGGLQYLLANPNCDPSVTGCLVYALVAFEFPNASMNIEDPYMFWFNVASAPVCDPSQVPGDCGSGGLIAGCGVAAPFIDEDLASTWYEVPNITCANVLTNPGVRSINGWTCPINDQSKLAQIHGIYLGGLAMAQAIGCEPPPELPRDDGGRCEADPSGRGADPGGGPAQPWTPAQSGPSEAPLTHQPAGPGRPTSPGASLQEGVAEPWQAQLGRHWSHPFAQRIVQDPDQTHVWLITGKGTFHEFSNLSGVDYLDVVPRDDYRTLSYLGAGMGWELTDLEGTVVAFDADGLWQSTTTRNGASDTADYAGGTRLELVHLRDGRDLDFAYDATGKLASITELGETGSQSRAWTYGWIGEDLTRVGLPDGRRLDFFYSDPRHLGYLTRQELVPGAPLDTKNPRPRRVQAAWQYDDHGNVVGTWTGDTTTTAGADAPGPAATNLYMFSFDDPATPTETTVTNPTGGTTVYTYDLVDGKTLVRTANGDCPMCGLGPSTSFEYDDPANPLLPTELADAEGNITELAYDANGQITSRTEAATDALLARVTTWTYGDSSFPSFPTEVSRDSVVAGCGDDRTTTIVYTTTGDVDHRSIGGCEEVDGMTQSLPVLLTDLDHNSGGQPLFEDPPGYGMDDRTTWTYEAPPGGSTRTVFNIASRTDSLLGTTLFDYDDLNRPVRSIDANGLVTDTQYDAMDRVVLQIRRGLQFTFADPGGYPTAPDDLPGAGDLATASLYDELGDLAVTTLPEGNRIVYGYEFTAAGRLLSIERQDAEALERERTFYETLDALGNRTLEKLQVWDGAQFVTASETASEYSPGGCHLTKTTVGLASSGVQSVTEYAYDCNGNLEEVWDANHPSAGQTATPSSTYAYDSLDRLVSVRQPWGGGGTAVDACDGTTTTDAVTCYGYDVQDHLVSVEDAERNVTTYHYSDRDLLTTQISNASGTTTYNYNLHGELVKEVDARPVITTRVVDAADRVTAVDYPGAALDISYDYSGTVATFSFGRLVGITRDGETVAYGYDLFGRLTTDGDLTYGYDDNGNRTSVTYPSGLVANYGFDFADREQTLEIDDGGGAQSVVTAASYLPGGPLTSLALQNGVTESRAFDGRYYPASIDISGLRRWSYSVDAVGNILQVDATANCEEDVVLDGETFGAAAEVLACETLEATDTDVGPPGPIVFAAGTSVSFGNGFTVASGAEFTARLDPNLAAGESYVYGYQDHQYFLTQGNGPWGTQSWTYDRIGNRETETKDGNVDDYVYEPQVPPGGNTPLLDRVDLALGGSREYSYGAAGHLEDVTASANVVDFTSDDAGRLSTLARTMGDTAGMSYDGRSFLAEVEVPPGGGDPAVTRPIYSSAGLLMSLERQENAASPSETFDYLSFAGRPVGQYKTAVGGSELQYLHPDRLGTPFLASDTSGTSRWEGPLEPFGRDWQEGTSAGATANELFLRFPGQWDDGRWENADLGAEVFYNVHRWYEGGVGKYTKADPLMAQFSFMGDQQPIVYVSGNPLRFKDLLGLYGTADCSYYKTRCRESGGRYYCETAPYFCDAFPETPDPDPNNDDDWEDWYRCTRKCLQDCDARDFERRKQCFPNGYPYNQSSPDPETESFAAAGHTRCHSKCYASCWAWRFMTRLP